MKIVNKKVLKKTPFVELVQTNYIDTKKKLGQWVWCRRPKGRKAVVIAAIRETPIYDHNPPVVVDYIRELVVIKEYRVPIEGYEIGFPAGLIDEGETPEDAVRRELEEETGLKVKSIKHISPAVLSSAGITDEAIHMAYVVVSGTPNKDKLEASEDIETYLMDVDELRDVMDSDGEDYVIGKSAYTIMRNFVKFGDI